MTISLRPEHEQFIQTQLASGRYASADEVLAQAFQLLDHWQQDHDEWLEITRQKVAIGLQQIERGEVIDGETVIAHLQEKINQARSAQS
jgi:antitoxin ParD1/3/4